MSKRHGDRKDAYRVDVPGLMQCCMDLKPGRLENEVYINEQIDVTELASFMDEKKAQGEKYTYFQAFLTAIGKVLFLRPKMNRFVANRHLYEHKDVTLSFVAKMTLDDKSEEIMLTIPLNKDDTIKTLAEKTAKRVSNLRSSSVDKKGANSAIDVLGKLPNIIRVPIFGIIKWLDKKGILPSGLMKDNIYFSSMIVSNLGSIHCGAIYHNLANFGTCSSLTAIGEITPSEKIMPDGSKQIRKLCEFGVTVDERIADGFYFAKSVKMIEYVLSHPELLDRPLGEEIEIS